MGYSIVIFLGILCMVWLFIKGAEPIQLMKKLLSIDNASTTRNFWLVILKKLVNCALCSGFWIGLIWYQSLPMAALVSISSEIFSRLIRLTFSKI